MAGGEVTVEVRGDGQEEVDFAKISIEEAFKILQTTEHGLSTAEAEKRLKEYGPNKLPEVSKNPILVFLGYMWNPLSWAMEAAAIIAIALLDYPDFALIVALLLLNSTISYIEEAGADAAVKALASALAPKCKCSRDGKVATLDAQYLVPGDVIIIKFGDVVPADVKLLTEEGGGAGQEETPMQIDQAALTGESLPAKKITGDVAFAGSAVKQGERHCVVYATGINTFFGRAAALIGSTNNVANITIVMTKIGALCLGTIAVWVIIELSVQFGHYHHACKGGESMCPTLENMLVIIVGGIPIAMPTVLSVTLALGAAQLAKEGAIVARQSAVEEMAGLDILCSDKTGTLTLNKLSVEVGNLVCMPGYQLEDVLKLAALSTNITTEEPIDVTLWEAYNKRDELTTEWKQIKMVPFNPVDKYTNRFVKSEKTGEIIRLMKGSPQVVLRNAHNSSEITEFINGKIVEFANRGFRALGIAKANGDGGDGVTKWEMVGLLPLFDPPRHDTKETIENCHNLGIEVKMVTGDHLLIGIETAKMLGMGTEMYASEELIKAKEGHAEHLHGHKDVKEMVEACNGFAEVFPEHKYEIVKILQDIDHMVGMTGDGVNDAPALKKADVGIAVAGATDAARGAADIVLTAPGLSTIVSAVIGARKIFQRMTTYAKYTVASTFRICFTFGLLTVIYDWYFPTILIVILAVFNDGAMIALSKDKVTPSPTPNSWNLKNIFIGGIVYGLYLTLSSWALYQTAVKTDIFYDKIGMYSLNDQYITLNTWCTQRLAQIPPAFPELNVTGPAAITAPACWAYDTISCNSGITMLDQCMAEQQFVRGAFMRSLLYLQVSISGQALVFVVRTQKHSFASMAGPATYLAFLFAQTGASAIAAFGFNGYPSPADNQGVYHCHFCTYSIGYPEPPIAKFFSSRQAPIAGTESSFGASVIGCTYWILVAWIWSAIWYVLLDPIKWMLAYALNEDGFRDHNSWLKDKKRSAPPHPDKERELGPAGMVAPSYGNPLGRASLAVAPQNVLERASVTKVSVERQANGLVRVSARPINLQQQANVNLQKQSNTILERASQSMNRKSYTKMGENAAASSK